MKIDICVCTYRRPSVVDTLASLDRQILPDGVTARIIVIDNDTEPTARDTVQSLAKTLTLPLLYVHAPANNISIARNAALNAADGEWLAFIDDDETAPETWLANLLMTAETEDLDAVFGPAMAVYPDDAPDWIRQQDYHSNIPLWRDGAVQTGYSCNALIRRTSPHVSGRYFSLDKGKTGGEDTEFFYNMWFSGAKLGIAGDAKVFEPVDPRRLSAEWIRNRRYRTGLSYGYHCIPNRKFLNLLRFATTTSLRIIFCMVIALALAWSERRRNFWFMRGVFHYGALMSVFSRDVPEQY